MVLASAPYLVAYILTPQGEVFSGFLSNPQDGNSYLAKMRQGFDGGWLFHNTYTAEEHGRAPLFLLHILLGKATALFGIDLIFVYHLARIIFGLILLISVHCLYVKFTSDRMVRRSAFLILAFGSGLSWLTVFWGHTGTDLTIPESNVFHELFANPHFTFGQAAFVWALLFYIQAIEEKKSRNGVIAGALMMVAVIAQPFVYITMAVLGLVWGALSLRSEDSGIYLGTVLKTYALVVLIPLPYLLVAYLFLYEDPVLARWTSQNITLSPPPWDYIIGGGFPLLLTIFGAKTLWRRDGVGPTQGRFILAWLIAMSLLVYFPVEFQRRLSIGMSIPLSLAAGFGLMRMVEWTGSRRAVRAVALGFCIPTSLFLITISVVGALYLRSPFYIPEDEVRAYNWLRENTQKEDVVLAGEVAGNQIPAWTGRRVVWGHPFETIDSERKRKLVEDFYTGRLSSEESVRTLTDTGATILYYGKREHQMGTLPTGIDTVIHPIYKDDDVEIFRIDRGALKR